jgi:hypothetical protein
MSFKIRHSLANETTESYPLHTKGLVMDYIQKTALHILLPLALAICIMGEIRAQDTPSIESPEQFILMRNSNVKQGRVYPAERQGHFRIITPNYSITLPSREVVFAGNTIHEVYLYRQSKIGTIARTKEDAARLAEQRGHLAEWCMRFGLAEQALTEISRAKILDEDNRSLLLSEQRVRRQLEDPSVSQASVQQDVTPSPPSLQGTDPFAPSAPMEYFPVPHELSTPPTETLPLSPPQVPPLGTPHTHNTIEAVGAQNTENPPPAEPTLAELDAIVRDMPGNSMRTFVRTIQPQLINSCGTVDCHGPGCDQKFQIAPPQAGVEVNRRLSQRNLYATLQWIDRERPAESPLLLKPIMVHGGLVEPVFTSREAERHRELVLWAFQIARYSNSLSPLSQISYRGQETELPIAAPLGYQMLPAGTPLVAPDSLYSPYGDGRPQGPSVAWVVPPTGLLVDQGATVPTPMERMIRNSNPSAEALRMSQGPQQGTPGQLFGPQSPPRDQTPSWLNSTNNPYVAEEPGESQQDQNGPTDPLDPSRFNGGGGPSSSNPPIISYPGRR